MMENNLTLKEIIKKDKKDSKRCRHFKSTIGVGTIRS